MRRDGKWRKVCLLAVGVESTVESVGGEVVGGARGRIEMSTQWSSVVRLSVVRWGAFPSDLLYRRYGLSEDAVRYQ